MGSAAISTSLAAPSLCGHPGQGRSFSRASSQTDLTRSPTATPPPLLPRRTPASAEGAPASFMSPRGEEELRSRPGRAALPTQIQKRRAFSGAARSNDRGSPSRTAGLRPLPSPKGRVQPPLQLQGRLPLDLQSGACSALVPPARSGCRAQSRRGSSRPRSRGAPPFLRLGSRPYKAGHSPAQLQLQQQEEAPRWR